MIVCHCKGITDATIRKSVREGSATVYAVGQHCCAGTACGGCHAAIDKIIRSELRANEKVVLSLPTLVPVA